MNADGLVSGERCNCEGQLKAEAEVAALRAHHRLCECATTPELEDCTFRASATEYQRELVRLRSEMAVLIQEMRTEEERTWTLLATRVRQWADRLAALARGGE
jgi:hypothetical protein